MNENIQKRLPIFIIALFLTGVFFSLFILLFSSEYVNKEVMHFPSSWSLQINDKVYENIDIEGYLFENKLLIGDELILTNIIPADIKTHQNILITSCLSTVQLFINDEEIYTYGFELYDKGKMVGSGFHLVNIPSGSAGKEFKLRFVITEDNAFTSVGKIRYGEVLSLFFDFMKYNISAITACIFLATFGTVLTILSVISLLDTDKFIKVIPVGLFSFLIGMYGLSSIHFLDLCGTNLRVNTLCEYVTLYMVPASVAFMFSAMMRRHSNLHKIVFGVASIWAVISIVLITMHFTNLIHFPRVLAIFQVLGAVSILIGVLAIVEYIRENGRSGFIVAVGYAVLCLAGISDLFRFNIQKYFMPNSNFANYCLLPIGSLVFVVIVIASYMQNVYHYDMEENEKRILAKLAYTDELCQIYNRTKCNEIMNFLDETKKPFSMVLFDLNGLKMINDTEGHNQGDVLIKEFASVLSESFENIGDVFRIGGDEFVVIVSNDCEDKIEIALSNVRRMEQSRGEILSMHIDSSYGVAHSSEVQNYSAQKVYTLADKRMYEMKRVFHTDKKDK